MAEITAALVKELRESSGAGMMDCKKALQENNGDIEAAKDWLRSKGLAAAAKKSGRVAAEGLVGTKVVGNIGALIELNSETDFVARNDQFQALASAIAEIAVENGQDVENLKKADFPGKGHTVQDEITDAIGVIGENLNLRRSAVLSVDEGAIVSYVHNTVVPGLGKIGVLVGLSSSGDQEKLNAFGKQIAMHVAAAKPESLVSDELDQTLIERERAIFIEQAKESGKPDEIIEKMVEGRIKKFYKEVVLLEQTFVIDGKISVDEAVKNFEKELGSPVSVTGFVRFELGDGIEKAESDFAEEVAAAAGN